MWALIYSFIRFLVFFLIVGLMVEIGGSSYSIFSVLSIKIIAFLKGSNYCRTIIITFSIPRILARLTCPAIPAHHHDCSFHVLSAFPYPHPY